MRGILFTFAVMSGIYAAAGFPIMAGLSVLAAVVLFFLPAILSN